MKTFEQSTSMAAATSSLSSNKYDKSILSLTNTPITYSHAKETQGRWIHGWATLFVVSAINFLGVFLNHGLALSVLSIPVLLFLNEGFKQKHVDEDATRKCAIEGFAKGAILGPPILALAETVGGILLALLCFGKNSFESIVVSASDGINLDLPTASFSTRLFREAASQDPYGSLAFAFLSSLLVAGLSEEAFKMGVGAWQVLKYRQHKRTLNPVIVMGGIGLGLAYAESIMAVLNLRGIHASRLACERVLTSFPIHIGCAVWTAKRASRLDSYIGALFPSALTHGVFDFGIILCANYLTRMASLGWSFTAAAATTMAGLNAG